MIDRKAVSFLCVAGVLVVALAACKSDESPDAAAPAAQAAPAAAAEAAPAAESKPAETKPAAKEQHERSKAAAPGTAWKDMNHEERGHFMKSVVMPKMRGAFAAFDPHEFGEMKCGACHGAGAKDKTFKMPNPRLPRLPKDAAGWAELEKREPDAMKFMKEQVVPQMAEMLGVPKYDPATGQGFGCFACHMARDH